MSLVWVSDSKVNVHVSNLPGVGKSTLGNQLLGGGKVFAMGHELESKTDLISIGVGKFLGTGDCFTLIDTPGARDTKGNIEMLHHHD